MALPSHQLRVRLLLVLPAVWQPLGYHLQLRATQRRVAARHLGVIPRQAQQRLTFRGLASQLRRRAQALAYLQLGKGVQPAVGEASRRPALVREVQAALMALLALVVVLEAKIQLVLQALQAALVPQVSLAPHVPQVLQAPQVPQEPMLPGTAMVQRLPCKRVMERIGRGTAVL